LSILLVNGDRFGLKRCDGARDLSTFKILIHITNSVLGDLGLSFSCSSVTVAPSLDVVENTIVFGGQLLKWCSVQVDNAPITENVNSNIDNCHD
jgi:hypothetical protein